MFNSFGLHNIEQTALLEIKMLSVWVFFQIDPQDKMMISSTERHVEGVRLPLNSRKHIQVDFKDVINVYCRYLVFQRQLGCE